MNSRERSARVLLSEFMMNAMLACGPGPGFVILVYAVLGGAVLGLGSLITGAILLIAGNRGLGLSLISFSILLGAALLLWFRIL